MSDKIFHSKALDLDFKIKENNRHEKVFVFEDGINYSSDEANLLTKMSDTGLRNVHKLKNIFNGEVIQ